VIPRATWLGRRLRRLHRWVVPLLLLEQGVDAFWLLSLHTGRFGPINLQPYYSIVLGLLTLVVISSGLGMLLASRGSKPPLASG